MTHLPLDDARTYEMLARGDSIGVFQFESEGMREALKKVRPDEFNDLVALNALYRPGAMDQIPVYARGKHNPQAISYPDERLRPILESSNGVILYQEQAMQISKELAGFSGAKADDLRKAIGKKNREAMAALKPEFVEGCRASGTKPEVIEFLWKTNEKSADYSFNKSHAACYGLIAYRTAWLKANHTAEYMAALISSVMSTKDKVPFFVARCEEMGIEILPPDVNLSDHEFTVGAPGQEGGLGNIRFGLDAVKGVGYQAVEAIKRAREDGGAFTSIWDFCERVDSRTVNKKAIEALDQVRRARVDRRHPQGDARSAREGAGQRPAGPAGRADRAGLDLRPPGRQRGRRRGRGRGLGHQRVRRARASADTHRRVRPARAAGRREGGDRPVRLRAPAQAAARRAARAVDCPISALEERRDKDWVTVGGIITEAKRIRTRSGDHMMFATLDDLAGSVEMLVFGKALAEHEAALAVDEVVIVKGRVDHKEAGKTCLVVQSVEAFAPSQEEIERASSQARAAARTATALAEPVKLRIAATDLSESTIDELRQTLEECRGTAEVIVEIDGSDGSTRRLRLGDDYRVRHTPTLLAELEHAVGRAGAVPAAALAAVASA